MKPEEDKIYGRIDFEQVIYLQLLKIGELSTRVFDEAESDTWQKNALNYYYAVKLLEAILYPYLDDAYFNELETIKQASIARYEERQNQQANKEPDNGYVANNIYHDVKDTIETTNEMIKLITRTLKKIGLLIPKQVSVAYGEEISEIEEE